MRDLKTLLELLLEQFEKDSKLNENGLCSSVMTLNRLKIIDQYEKERLLIFIMKKVRIQGGYSYFHPVPCQKGGYEFRINFLKQQIALLQNEIPQC